MTASHSLSSSPGRKARVGTALTAAGLCHLLDLGLEEVMLFVDESNASARAMYQSLGFTEHHSDSAMGLTL